MTHLVSLKLVENEIVDHEPPPLPTPVLRGAVLEVAADGSTLVASPHLPQDRRKAHVLVPGEGSCALLWRSVRGWGG